MFVSATDGEKMAPPGTTSVNLSDKSHGIPLDSMPATFRDAVIVTRALGYRYLWIDSVCILQDDLADWNRECPKMAAIYRGAAVTIAAVASENCFDGLLRAREGDIIAPRIRVQSQEAGIDCILAIRPLSDYVRSFESASALESRAWTLQETLLPSRVLHFGSQQTYFDCKSWRACEGFVLTDFKLDMMNVNMPKDFLYSFPGNDLYGLWNEIIELYSRRHLTFEDDRLPALSGLAAFLRESLQDEYIAGLWRSHLIDGLQWETAHLRSSLELARVATSIKAKVPAPSWTWAACGHPVKHYMDLYRVQAGKEYHDLFPSFAHVTMHDVQLTFVGSDKFGQVSSGRIILSGRMQVVKLGRPGRVVTARHKGPYYPLLYSMGAKPRSIGRARLDVPVDDESFFDEPTPDSVPSEDYASGTMFECLLLSIVKFPDSNNTGERYLWFGLILEQVGDEENAFRRIGLVREHYTILNAHEDKNSPTDTGSLSAEEHASMTSIPDFFKEAETRTVTLV